MGNDQLWKAKGINKAEWLTEEVAKTIGAGKSWKCETVDFSDPNRPSTCIEVDFPIVPINRNAAIESASGAAVKPIYKATKWWARRSPSVFRAILLASVMPAPVESSEAAKKTWSAFYANHQPRRSFNNIKVADIFLGGGTTVVEGSRLGMQMYGNDLNPVAWFAVKNGIGLVEKGKVEALLQGIEAEVKPKIMPFYSCSCPRGHKGKWKQISSDEEMGDDFDPLLLTLNERNEYRYQGPEIIYTFWAKHGPCQVSGCGHRTPILASPVIAIKTLTVKSWLRTCKHCGSEYDLEEREARMAPGAPLVVAETERPFVVARFDRYGGSPDSIECPSCGMTETLGKLGKNKGKKVELSLLIHPEFLKGEAAENQKGQPYGGSADDPVEETINWNLARAEKVRFVEVRGNLPAEIKCPSTGVVIKTGKNGGTVPKKSNYSCGSCGTTQDILTTVKASGKTGPIAMYAHQCYCPECDKEGQLYRGRYFSQASSSHQYDSALREWDERKNTDLSDFWPKSEIPFGFMTHQNNGGIPNHGFTHWSKMFHGRQLLVHAQLLKQIGKGLSKESTQPEAFAVLGAFQQYLRFNCLFTVYHPANDQSTKHFANNNFAPKNTMLETPVFSSVGDGTWLSACKGVLNSAEYGASPWDTLAKTNIEVTNPNLAQEINGKSSRVYPGDAIDTGLINLFCCSSTELSEISDNEIDLVVTDPPFGGLLHYAELSDFFYVWLRLCLRQNYDGIFSAEHTPKTLEVVANKARHPEDPDGFYSRLLTDCWKEANRILKTSGLLVFTFHHSEDAPWVAVLESLFKAGFTLHATYPVRSDTAFAEQAKPGAFGSQKIEYDIIHVCRKRNEEPSPISWAKLRRQVLHDVRELQDLLEHHQKEGLPEADMQVIRRGKALEYYSRHYGKVFKDEDTPMSVLEALLGINQLLDEEAGGIKEAPPHNAEPFTRMLLRLFDRASELPRDQIQKFLRGTGSAPSDFVNRGWMQEVKKVFYLTPPLDLAQAWIGKHRKGLQSDYGQAMFLIGACFEGSGIDASETLNNENFKPHPALGAILTWFKTHGADSPVRNAATTAAQLYRTWETKNQAVVQQLSLFETLGEDEA
jgi:putative DNA methylase